MVWFITGIHDFALSIELMQHVLNNVNDVNNQSTHVMALGCVKLMIKVKLKQWFLL